MTTHCAPKKLVTASCVRQNDVPHDYPSVLSGTIIEHSGSHSLNSIFLSTPHPYKVSGETLPYTAATPLIPEKKRKDAPISAFPKLSDKLLPGGQ